jgi:hypothetical protein
MSYELRVKIWELRVNSFNKNSNAKILIPKIQSLNFDI